MSNSKSISSAAVIGAGQMGAGIAQVIASKGINVKLYDNSSEALKKGLTGIDKRLGRLVDKEKISEEQKSSALALLGSATKLEEISDVDLVVEAIIENTEIKLELFKQLDQICNEKTILATNTSSISITKIAGATNRPEKVIGQHYMNPVPIMKLVEVIRGLQTSDETYETSIGFIETLGKTAVTANHDYPGFIVNRILIPMLNEAVFVLMEGTATVEEIDTAMKLGTNQPMGPLELADFVGIDTCLAIAEIFHKELGEDKYRPCPLLVKYVEAGWYGRKTGRGFYVYD
ncbi:3-hydroxybutyryl-CoA dehydrogenase [bacterium J17]|nr:3-hydroxybutyryl-CoA dehydrogenase [bacterium J17]